MKTQLLLTVILTISLFMTTCKKQNEGCNNITELKDKNHLVDPSSLNSQALNDTLTKYPELQIYKIKTYPDHWTVFCNVFYENLIVFTSGYVLSYYNNTITSYDTLCHLSIPISLTPTIDYFTAIKIAKQKMDYSNTCIAYRLGIYDLNAYNENYQKSYKLVWKINGDNGYPWVILDATNGQIYRSDDGMRPF